MKKMLAVFAVLAFCSLAFAGASGNDKDKAGAVHVKMYAPNAPIDSIKDTNVITISNSYHTLAWKDTGGVTRRTDRPDSLLSNFIQTPAITTSRYVYGPPYSGTNIKDRRGEITATSATGTFQSGTATDLIDGTLCSSCTYFGCSGNVLNKWVCFHFKSPTCIVEIIWIRSYTYSTGYWHWQASQDSSVWVNIGSGFNLNAAQDTMKQFNTNTTTYNFYRMYGDSGALNCSPYEEEVVFKELNKQVPAQVKIQSPADRTELLLAPIAGQTSPILMVMDARQRDTIAIFDTAGLRLWTGNAINQRIPRPQLRFGNGGGGIYFSGNGNGFHACNGLNEDWIYQDGDYCTRIGLGHFFTFRQEDGIFDASCRVWANGYLAWVGHADRSGANLHVDTTRMAWCAFMGYTGGDNDPPTNHSAYQLWCDTTNGYRMQEVHAGTGPDMNLKIRDLAYTIFKDSTCGPVIKDAAGINWRIKVGINGVVTADSTGVSTLTDSLIVQKHK